jgi:acyl-CoA hydrolase
MTYSAQYRNKRRTAQEAAGLVRSGDWVDYGFALNMPVAFDEALAARSGEIDDVKIRGTLALKPLKAAEAEGFSYNSWHFSGYERKLAAQGRCHYLPMLYRNMPLYYRRELTVDVAVCQVAPIDHHGHFSFSISNSASRAILEKARLVIVEVNQRMPRALGGFAESIHISDVDVIIEGTNPPLSELPPGEPSEIEKAIASLLVEQIPDGATAISWRARTAATWACTRKCSVTPSSNSTARENSPTASRDGTATRGSGPSPPEAMTSISGSTTIPASPPTPSTTPTTRPSLPVTMT